MLEVAPDQATVRYWQAYLLRKKSPERSREVLEKAAALSPYLVFPFREESIPVFQWAADGAAERLEAEVLPGLDLLGTAARTRTPCRCWSACGDRPDYAPAYISRAFSKGTPILRRPRRTTRELTPSTRKIGEPGTTWPIIYTEKGIHDKALKLAVEASRQFPKEDAIKVLLARAYLNNGRYQDCNSVLANATILPFEGQSDVHNLFVQCLVSQAMADMKKGQYRQAIERLEASREYPERLGTGEPADPDYRVQDYLVMFCYQKRTCRPRPRKREKNQGLGFPPSGGQRRYPEPACGGVVSHHVPGAAGT